MQTVAIFNDTHGWHSAQLQAALAQRGLAVVLTDLADCRVDLHRPHGLSIAGFASDQWPDAVIVRGIAPGSHEQITLRMDVLHTLAESGIPVLNSAAAVELTVDKARTSLRLQRAGLPTPITLCCESQDMAIAHAAPHLQAGGSWVLKPLFGCQGKGLVHIDSLDALRAQTVVGDTYYLQAYVPPSMPGQWQDWRVMVVDGRVVGCMRRQATQWITNFAQGAQCHAAVCTPQMAELAIAACNTVACDYAGVDLIQNPAGDWLVLEVNSVPAWKGLTQATQADVAGALADLVLRRLAPDVDQSLAC